MTRIRVLIAVDPGLVHVRIKFARAIQRDLGPCQIDSTVSVNSPGLVSLRVVRFCFTLVLKAVDAFLKGPRGPGMTFAKEAAVEQRGTTLARIRVLIADDHGLVRAGIRALLEKQSSIEVLAEASNGLEALLLVRQHQPDVVLMDIGMPELNGLEAVRQLAKDFPKVRCIILSMHADEEHVWQALQAGAAGYLVKGGSLAELELAITSVAQGTTYLSPGVSGPVIKEYVRRTSHDGDSANSLTPRQREILQMIAEGKNTKRIALILGISVKTVESHRAQLMNRLGVQDIASLVRYALRIGLVEF